MSQFNKPSVSVPASGLTTIATIKNVDSNLLCFHFDVATQDLDDFEIYGRANDGAQLVLFTPAWASLPITGHRVLDAKVHTTSTGAYVDKDLDTVLTTENGYFEMDVTGLVEIVVKASAATDSAIVSPQWSLN